MKLFGLLQIHNFVSFINNNTGIINEIKNVSIGEIGIFINNKIAIEEIIIKNENAKIFKPLSNKVASWLINPITIARIEINK